MLGNNSKLVVEDSMLKDVFLNVKLVHIITKILKWKKEPDFR